MGAFERAGIISFKTASSKKKKKEKMFLNNPKHEKHRELLRSEVSRQLLIT